MPYCIVNEKAGYIYCNVPKTACTSIKLAIAEHMQVKFRIVQWKQPYRQSLEYAAERPDLLSFAFVRHPADRLVSCWADWCQPPYPDKGNYLKNLDMLRFRGWTFQQFVTHIVRLESPDEMNEHYRPQSRVLSIDDTLVPQRIYQFEHLRETWVHLQAEFGLPDLPHDRASEHAHWRTYYTEKTLWMVEDCFRADYELFGYPREVS